MPFYLSNSPFFSTKIHYFIPKFFTIRHNKDRLIEIINYITQEYSVLSEASIRIYLSLISMLQTNTVQVEHLIKFAIEFRFHSLSQIFTLSKKLRQTSIYTYYANFAEARLFHTSPYI